MTAASQMNIAGRQWEGGRIQRWKTADTDIKGGESVASINVLYGLMNLGVRHV